MPKYCAVPECDTRNATLKKSKMCKFPKNPEIMKLWLQNLNLENWQPTNMSEICESHFRSDDFIVCPTISKRKTKEVQKLLKDNAVPTLFPNLPNAYNIMISTEEVPIKLQEAEAKRKEQEAKRKKQEESNARREQLQSSIALMKREQEDFVRKFANFKAHVKEKISLGNYYLYETEKKCVFYQIVDSEDSDCVISIRISVNDSLKIRVLIGDSEDSRHFERLRIINQKLVKFSQLANLLDAYRYDYDSSTVETEKLDCKSLLQRALQCLISAKPISANIISADKLDIIINQLEINLKPSHPKYNSETIKMAAILFTHSHATLKMIQKFLCLPSTRSLQRISSKMLISTNFDIPTRKDRNLSDPENFVALIIDELYIDRGLQYNNNKMVGTAILNPSQDPKTLLLDTKTILTFTVQSIFGNLREIVRMSPAIYPFGDIIYSHTKDALDSIQNMGYNVKVVIADTNKNGQRIFQRFSDKNHHFTNPKFPDHKTYLQYDVLQILKDIRNDWLDLKNAGRTFIYPDMENMEIKEALFTDFESLLGSDNLRAVKKAPKLTEAAINPNDMDKKNVTLASDIFHESTISALRGENMCGTADFCATFKKWWDIVTTNVPILLDSDQRFIYLENFVNWVETWQKIRNNQGRLKYRTFIAIQSTTKTFIELIKFSFANCQAEFLDLSKLQKDSLENRFKFYESKMKSKPNQVEEGNVEEINVDEEFATMFQDDLDDPLDWETEYLDDEQDAESYKLHVTVNYD